MNGLGIAQTFSGVIPLLFHLKSLLQPKGQILVDSSDLIYLFPETLDWRMADLYYGELDYGLGLTEKKKNFLGCISILTT